MQKTNTKKPISTVFRLINDELARAHLRVSSVPGIQAERAEQNKMSLDFLAEKERNRMSRLLKKQRAFRAMMQ